MNQISDQKTCPNSLGLMKAPKDTRVVVAMSGGVDSSVVAAKLCAEGYEVIGITLQLYDHGRAVNKQNACCAGRDIHDAKRVAERMGFPHYVLDYEDRFQKSVIDEFADSYLAGATPIPCIRCNMEVKFRDLRKMARELDADCLATGHYVRREMGECPAGGAPKAQLHRAIDLTRDQSYFLFATTQEQLDYLRFPLGGLSSKEETRALASKYGLNIAHKPDSQDICFVPDGDYAGTIAKHRPGAVKSGEIVHMDGRVMGHHDGVINFTIGQRRGLALGGGEPFYVNALDVVNHRVIIGPKEALARNEIGLSGVNWLGDEWPKGEISLDVKIRSTGGPARASLQFQDRENGNSNHANSRAIIRLEMPEEGVAPGQACVFYEKGGSRVLGGGWIASARLV